MKSVFFSTLLFFTYSSLAWESNGYVEEQLAYTSVHSHSLISASSIPKYSSNTEVNLQLKDQFNAEKSLFYSDISLLSSFNQGFVGLDAKGNEVSITPTKREKHFDVFTIHEFFSNHGFSGGMSILVGKKRVLWGPGVGVNPTDLINPPKNPSDPTLQREGAYVAQLEDVSPNSTFTLLASPLVVHGDNGLPKQTLRYKNATTGVHANHYLLAARAYFLVADSDLNAILYFSNLYNDAFKHKFRLGLSGSHIFFRTAEFHFELIAASGSARIYANSSCVQDKLHAQKCVNIGSPFASPSKLTNSDLNTNLLMGHRYYFANDAQFNIEWLHQSGGYTPKEFNVFLQMLSLQGGTFPLSEASSESDLSLSGGNGLFLQQNYILLSLLYPKIYTDDFSMRLGSNTSLQDLSGVFSTTFSWDATEWLRLNLTGLGAYKFSSERGVHLAGRGKRVTEQDLIPVKYQLAFETQAFF